MSDEDFMALPEAKAYFDAPDAQSKEHMRLAERAAQGGAQPSLEEWAHMDSLSAKVRELLKAWRDGREDVGRDMSTSDGCTCDLEASFAVVYDTGPLPYTVLDAESEVVATCPTKAYADLVARALNVACHDYGVCIPCKRGLGVPVEEYVAEMERQRGEEPKA